MRGLVPTGGTPLASGLRLAVRTVRNEELKNPGVQPVMLIISDGEATVPLGNKGDPYLELIEMAEQVRIREEILTICIDTKEQGPQASGRTEMRRLSEALGAAYYHRNDLLSPRP
jgi:magnesium chelatase subunit D